MKKRRCAPQNATVPPPTLNGGRQRQCKSVRLSVKNAGKLTPVGGKCMRRAQKLPELLSPCGDYDSLVAAVRAGADAVYVGGKSFNARAGARNFDGGELHRAVRYCHLHKVKIYVTVNTLIYDREMKELSDYALFLYGIGVDAIICTDVGAISEIRRRVPNLEIHASTQMSVHNGYGAQFAASLGCTRVVLARELSYENIKSVTEKCSIETEVFLHGALCVCHSGQCLMSSMLGGRSGNRGECAQPCRLPYNNGRYILSLRDMSLANHIRELCESGVASLKIEGRMKSPEYVYNVTRIYRILLDEYRDCNKAEAQLLQGVFSRGGFTDGYFKMSLAKMTGIRSEEDKEKSREIEPVSNKPDKISVRAKAKITAGAPSELTLFSPEKRVSVFGAVPQPAQSKPLVGAEVKARLAKMGATFLSLREEDIELELEDGLNLSPAEINNLRRMAADKFEDTSRDISFDGGYIPSTAAGYNKGTGKLITAQFFDKDVYFTLRRKGGCIDMIDIAFLPLMMLEDCETSGKIGVYLPPVIAEGTETETVERRLEFAKSKGVRKLLVSNVGQFIYKEKMGFEIYFDFRLNVFNSLPAKELFGRGAAGGIVSAELTLPMARDIGAGVFTLGRVPLMITERCFIKENFGCENCNKASLTDRRGEKFPIMREQVHRNVIFNSKLTYMGDKADELRRAGIWHEHFIFSVEDADTVCRLLASRKAGRSLGDVRRIGKREAKA